MKKRNLKKLKLKKNVISTFDASTAKGGNVVALFSDGAFDLCIPSMNVVCIPAQSYFVLDCQIETGPIPLYTYEC